MVEASGSIRYLVGRWESDDVEFAASSLSNLNRGGASLQERGLAHPQQNRAAGRPPPKNKVASTERESGGVFKQPSISFPDTATSSDQTPSAGQLLGAMIIRMGGAPQSVFKGMYVDLKM